MNYETELKKHVIRDYVSTNNRSPNAREVQVLIDDAKKLYPSLQDTGFSGYQIVKASFASPSSAEVENANREALLTDSLLISRRAMQSIEKLENMFTGSYATVQTIKSKLRQLENRVDNLLLLTGSDSAFVYGLEEDFTNHTYLDVDQTTANVENGFVTLGRAGWDAIDLTEVKLSATAVAANGYLGIQNTSQIDALKVDDGNFWEFLVYTNYQQGRVSCVLNFELPEPTYIAEFRLSGQTKGVNGPTVGTLFYSIDGKTYKALEPAEQTLINSDTVFAVNVDKIAKLRLVLSKENFDTTVLSSSANQYVYAFILDGIKLYAKSFEKNSLSQAVFGPYSFYDTNEQVVSFSKATTEICFVDLVDTSVSLFLSTDGVNWINSDPKNNPVVLFGSSKAPESQTVLNVEAATDALIQVSYLEMEDSEVLVNTGVAVNYQDSYVLKSFVVKRNIPYFDAGERVRINNVHSGWVFNESSRLYRTTVNCTTATGIDLGNTSAYINGVLLTGFITLLPGYTVFETAETNYVEVPAGLTSLSGLKAADPLYPYNHKLLIEGYAYPVAYKGEKLYLGVKEYFSDLCKLVPYEVFETSESSMRDIFCLENTLYGTFAKLKVEPNKPDWTLEKTSVDWMTPKADTNKLWFKLTMSSTAEVSAIVTSVKIGVI